jgi:hypothetical protein
MDAWPANKRIVHVAMHRRISPTSCTHAFFEASQKACMIVPHARFPVTIRQAQPRPNLPFQTSRSLLDKATPCGSTFCSPQLIRLSGFQQTGRCHKPPRLLLSLNNKEVIYRKIPCTVTESRGLRYVDTCTVIRHLPYTYATGSCIARL